MVCVCWVQLPLAGFCTDVPCGVTMASGTMENHFLLTRGEFMSFCLSRLLKC